HPRSLGRRLRGRGAGTPMPAPRPTPSPTTTPQLDPVLPAPPLPTVVHRAPDSGARCTLVGPLGRSRALERPEQFEDRANAEASAARGELAVVVVAVGRPGDVEVRPWDPVADEAAQEQRGNDRAAVAAADVLQVGDLRLEVLRVPLDERQAPHRLTRHR